MLKLSVMRSGGRSHFRVRWWDSRNPNLPTVSISLSKRLMYYVVHQMEHKVLHYMQDYMILFLRPPLVLAFLMSALKVILAAVSKASLTPCIVLAEHSIYSSAPIICPAFWPFVCVTGLELVFPRVSTVSASFRRSTLFPENKCNLTEFLSWSLHCDITF